MHLLRNTKAQSGNQETNDLRKNSDEQIKGYESPVGHMPQVNKKVHAIVNDFKNFQVLVRIHDITKR